MLHLSLTDLVTYQLFIGGEKACLSLPDGRQVNGQIKSGLVTNLPEMTKRQIAVYVILVGPNGPAIKSPNEKFKGWKYA